MNGYPSVSGSSWFANPDVAIRGAGDQTVYSLGRDNIAPKTLQPESAQQMITP